MSTPFTIVTGEAISDCVWVDVEVSLVEEVVDGWNEVCELVLVVCGTVLDVELEEPPFWLRATNPTTAAIPITTIMSTAKTVVEIAGLAERASSNVTCLGTTRVAT
jgi:hypothetical protein